MLLSLPYSEEQLRERAARYRVQAMNALQQAMKASDADARKGFMNLAAGWHELAEDLEIALGHGSAGAEDADVIGQNWRQHPKLSS